MSEPVTADGPGELVARERLGAALRSLGHAVVGRYNAAAVLDEVAAQLEGALERLERGEPRRRDPESFGNQFVGDAPADGPLPPSMPDRPFSGKASPWSVDMAVRREGDVVVTDVTLGPAHEGAPGRSHGGVVSGTFDDLMGFVLQLERLRAFTGELTVRYLAGMPIGEPVRFRSWLRERSGRKLYIDADATAGGTIVATATAVFIAVD
ncbi:MAG: PaaI family thioesterase [Acidimicrobiales bacterium]